MRSRMEEQKFNQINAQFFTVEREDGTTTACVTVDGFTDKANATSFLAENHEFLKSKLIIIDALNAQSSSSVH